jgi:hypothetical protein
MTLFSGTQLLARPAAALGQTPGTASVHPDYRQAIYNNGSDHMTNSNFGSGPWFNGIALHPQVCQWCLLLRRYVVSNIDKISHQIGRFPIGFLFCALRSDWFSNQKIPIIVILLLHPRLNVLLSEYVKSATKEQKTILAEILLRSTRSVARNLIYGTRWLTMAEIARPCGMTIVFVWVFEFR